MKWIDTNITMLIKGHASQYEFNQKTIILNPNIQKSVLSRVVLNFFRSNSSNHRIIKCICFKLIYCAINVYTVSSYRVFNEFDYIFISELI